MSLMQCPKTKKIVVSIKAHTGLTSGGKRPVGKISSSLNEIYFLTLVEAPTRILMLTNRSFYELFMRANMGKIPSDISVEHIELPLDMQVEVDAVTARARREMVMREGFSVPTTSPVSDVGVTLDSLEAPIDGYWTYENDVNKYARVHKSECSHCQNGRGSHDAVESRHGRWINKFDDIEAAFKVSKYSTSACEHCLPNG